MLKNFSLILTVLVGISCSQTPSYQEDFQAYVSQVEQNAKVMPKPQFRGYLAKEIEQKESHLAVLQEHYRQEGEVETSHQSGGYSTSDIQQLNVRNSQIKLHDMADKIKILEKKIFYLKSKLSLLK